MGGFLKNTSGNMAVITALCATALLGAAGVAVDFVRQNDEDTAYAAAADAAALAGAALIREHTDWSAGKIKTDAKAEALKSWKANLTPALYDQIKTPDVKIVHSGMEWTVRVSYDGTMPTSLLAVTGVKSVPLRGEAVSAVGQNQTHWQFNFAIDTSSSMGIGATQADMDAMVADPNIGCMFACHNSTTNADTVNQARVAGYKLRLDVVDEAVDNTIDIIKSKPSITPKASLYGTTTGITDLVSETANLNDVKNHDIQVAYMNASLGNTNYRAALEELTSKIGTAGDGSSASKPRKVVFIVTDGIHDTTVPEPNVDYYWWADHQLGTLDPSFCQDLKDKGVIVGVLYINYIVPAGYEGVLTGYENKILPNMQSCASDGFFHNATDKTELQAAFADMLAKAFNSDVRLTQ